MMSALHDRILAHFQRQGRSPVVPATVGDVLDVAMMLADEIERSREDMVEGGMHVRDFVTVGSESPDHSPASRFEKIERMELPVERKPGLNGQVMNFLDFEAIRNSRKPTEPPASPVLAAPTPPASSEDQFRSA